MKCTIENLKEVFNAIEQNHSDSIGDGADFAWFDNESDLLTAVETTIDELGAEKYVNQTERG